MFDFFADNLIILKIALFQRILTRNEASSEASKKGVKTV